MDEIDRISGNTEFNTKNLLGHKGDAGAFDGAAQDFTFHIGANEKQSITLSIKSMDSERIGTIDATTPANSTTIKSLKSTDGAGGALTTQADADKAITTINDAIELVSAERSKLGAHQNRLEHTINNLSTSSENLSAAC